MVPNFQKFMLPVLKLSAKDEQTFKTCEPIVSAELGLTDEDRQEMLGSKRSTKVESRIYWAKTYLNQAGLVELHRRGFFQITDKGRELLKENPSEITLSTLSAYPEFKEFMERSNTQSTIQDNTQNNSHSNATPEERIQSGIDELNIVLKQNIISKILDCSPKFFEILILDLLRAMGYGADDECFHHVGGPGDQGIDGIITQDPLGLEKIYIQAKRYSAHNLIDNNLIQNFFGAVAANGSNKGIFVTTSSFKPSAIEVLKKNPTLKIILIDGSMLTDLMIKYNVGLSIETTHLIKRIDTDYFQNDLS